MGRPAKPDDQKVNRVPRKLEWTHLPAAGRQGPPPKLPKVAEWSKETRRWWKELWQTPQATQWDQTGRTAVPMAVLYQAMQDAPVDKLPAIAGALLAREDRHGLNPKAMGHLCWRIVDDAEEAPAATPANDRRDRLRVA